MVLFVHAAKIESYVLQRYFLPDKLDLFFLVIKMSYRFWEFRITCVKSIYIMEVSQNSALCIMKLIRITGTG